MNKLKEKLFIATHKEYRKYLRMQENHWYTEMEIMAVKSSYQTLYRFLYAEGLESEYLAWVERLINAEQEEK